MLRVSGKSKDDPQKAIALLKQRDEGLPLRFMNYRQVGVDLGHAQTP
jgi:uncharacterized protein YajQ (UPF0234 family)